jgi:hypothetical protein
MKRSHITVLGFIVLALAVAGATAAGTRPFRCVGDVILNTPNGSGSGHAVHVGQVTGTGVVTAVGQARVTLTASNGDRIELVAHYEADGSGGWRGTFEVTGGSGRFDGATGSGTIVASRNADGTIAADAKGTVSY